MSHILAIDSSIFCYNVVARNVGDQDIETVDDHVLNLIKAELCYVNSRQWLTNGEPMRVLWLLDSSPYWRSHYEPEYKQNRIWSPLKDSIIYARNFISENFFCWEEKEFEADDLAGQLVRNKDQFQSVTLVSSDSDWMGLIQDGVNIVNPFFAPYVRGRVESFAWYVSKLHKESKFVQEVFDKSYLDYTPTDIWLFKQAVGDKIDNIAPNSHLGIINLINPLVKPTTLPKLEEIPIRLFDLNKQKQFSDNGVLTIEPVRLELC